MKVLSSLIELKDDDYAMGHLNGTKSDWKCKLKCKNY